MHPPSIKGRCQDVRGSQISMIPCGSGPVRLTGNIHPDLPPLQELVQLVREY